MIGLAYQYFANKSTLLLGGRILFAKVVGAFVLSELKAYIGSLGAIASPSNPTKQLHRSTSGIHNHLMLLRLFLHGHRQPLNPFTT